MVFQSFLKTTKTTLVTALDNGRAELRASAAVLALLGDKDDFTKMEDLLGAVHLGPMG